MTWRVILHARAEKYLRTFNMPTTVSQVWTRAFCFPSILICPVGRALSEYLSVEAISTLQPETHLTEILALVRQPIVRSEI
jgi:hypothetical protein